MPPAPPAEKSSVAATPGHVDLVGLPPGEAQRVAADDRLEEGDVGREGDDVEADRDPDPERIGIVELAQRVAKPDQLREEEVDPDQQRDDHDRRLDQAPPREERQFGGIVAVSPDPRETLLRSYPLARRSKRCRPRVTPCTAGSASGSPRRTAATRPAPASRSVT